MLGRRPETVVGVDEAGRGAWIGPLVVGAVAVARSAIPELVRAGARDSKALSPRAREEVYARLERAAELRSVEASPAEVDRHAEDGRLNELEARLFDELARPLGPAELRVDACDVNPRRFASRVAAHAGPGATVIARHRFDALDPVVGAASIVAKVRRDRAIRALAENLRAEIGSGYPSDARTVAFVRGFVRRDAPLPPWLRASWATTQRVIGSPPPRAARWSDR